MAVKTEIGPRVYQEAIGAAVLNYSPPNDRAAIIRRISIQAVSGNDTWTVSVAGRELMRFRVLTTGNQRLLFLPTAGSTGATQAYRPNFFDWCRNVLGMDPSISVPLGMTLSIASVGGATATIVVEGKEVDRADADIVGLNHYKGNVFLMPITWFLNAAFSGAAGGAVQLDTQVAPAYVPALFSNAQLPAGWKVELLALFLEGAGVNTFSGAANHQSATRDLQVFKAQTQLFTRTAHGITNIGSASAAGSANTVLAQAALMFPPFEQSGDNADSILEVPLQVQTGEAMQLLHELTGDGTGGASYATALQVAIARVTVPLSSAGAL